MTIVVMLVVTLAAGAVGAQEARPPNATQPASGMMGMRGMMMGPGAIMGMGGAAMLLQLREPLGLSEDQFARVETIQARAEEEQQQHLRAAMQAHHEAMEALAAEAPDLAAYEGRLREAANHWVLAQVAEARALEEAQAVLTPEQRANARFAMRAMHTMMRQHMRGMMGGNDGADHRH